ncbi:hypothetical protein K435DRAFT_854344 [Dendrothele bispora CBS 962.96]|uniref:GPI ethanolamine phosphate transferase 1 n=1 Tax=Dendrothele bispora (strain CBS 962.96) TaxID=1314807 RepID=A0A4S8ME38_DENBC|nr:hypothetical protein K435DRAFT_854344 [Dendrothele bispora CBS 962.96]
MDQLRRRVPFKLAAEDNEDQNTILDESEQEELVQRLREENAKLNRRFLLVTQAIVSLSALLHLIYLFSPTEEPLLLFFPSPAGTQTPSKPLPRPFTLLSLAVHVNMLFLVNSGTTTATSLLQLRFGDLQFGLHPLSYSTSYALALVAPTVCLFLGRSWLTMIWWSITLGIVFAVQSVQDSITSGNESISALDALKYNAPGA